MPLNLELKARLRSLDEARTQAASLGARFDRLLLQTDTYYRVPRGRLKLRTLPDDSAELILYDRPETEPERWSRFEVVPVGDGIALGRVLAEALGVRVTVRKRRDLYLYEGARIHLDDVDGLGTFLEFEVQGGDEAAARGLLARLSAWFGVGEHDLIQASYADLLEASGTTGFS